MQFYFQFLSDQLFFGYFSQLDISINDAKSLASNSLTYPKRLSEVYKKPILQIVSRFSNSWQTLAAAEDSVYSFFSCLVLKLSYLS